MLIYNQGDLLNLWIGEEREDYWLTEQNKQMVKPSWTEISLWGIRQVG